MSYAKQQDIEAAALFCLTHWLAMDIDRPQAGDWLRYQRLLAILRQFAPGSRNRAHLLERAFPTIRQDETLAGAASGPAHATARHAVHEVQAGLCFTKSHRDAVHALVAAKRLATAP